MTTEGDLEPSLCTEKIVVNTRVCYAAFRNHSGNGATKRKGGLTTDQTRLGTL